MANEHEIPSLPDEVTTITESMRRVLLIMEDVQRGADMTSGLHKYDAVRQLTLAKNALEEVEHRLGRAIKAATLGLKS